MTRGPRKDILNFHFQIKTGKTWNHPCLNFKQILLRLDSRSSRLFRASRSFCRSRCLTRNILTMLGGSQCPNVANRRTWLGSHSRSHLGMWRRRILGKGLKEQNHQLLLLLLLYVAVIVVVVAVVVVAVVVVVVAVVGCNCCSIFWLLFYHFTRLTLNKTL